ncbi:hypothetical protein H4J02_06665 [Protaetiibacter sp. SSC-01]|uniref:hypothetical protein n=1 Tax=Protaetiibacter sp. SSC-01 TaxID=2759943 RepID=UPI00165713B5|nr:hypothetical protein [Protaetiibacter sp. SSC-01]QNO38667.1 hypothetical protein H4J02_06665 [Protaetiibacter sp. SSC-01]
MLSYTPLRAAVYLMGGEELVEFQREEFMEGVPLRIVVIGLPDHRVHLLGLVGDIVEDSVTLPTEEYGAAVLEMGRRLIGE